MPLRVRLEGHSLGFRLSNGMIGKTLIVQVKGEWSAVCAVA
jgi:hypothetical protein